MRDLDCGIFHGSVGVALTQRLVEAGPVATRLVRYGFGRSRLRFGL
jgi:hypothetical protein